MGFGRTWFRLGAIYCLISHRASLPRMDFRRDRAAGCIWEEEGYSFISHRALCPSTLPLYGNQVTRPSDCQPIAYPEGR